LVTALRYAASLPNGSDLTELDQLKRRSFITLLGGVLAAWPLAARAQQRERMRRLAVLMPYPEGDAEVQVEVAAFREQLQKLGWTQGRNLLIDYRWPGDQVGRIHAAAKELVALQPDAILVRSTPVTRALMQETRAIPIVFLMVSDPVGDGLIANFANPGSNVTGFTNAEASLGGKWIELLKEIAPGLQRLGALTNPKTAPGRGAYYEGSVESAAASMGLKLVTAVVESPADIQQAIDSFAREPNGGLLVLPDLTTATHRAQIIALAAPHRLPAVYGIKFYATEGGLMSYGADPTDLYRRSATYIDRVLRGEKPGALPVQAPVKFELVINLKTAKALGLDVPWFLQQRADEVIE